MPGTPSADPRPRGARRGASPTTCCCSPGTSSDEIMRQQAEYLRRAAAGSSCPSRAGDRVTESGRSRAPTRESPACARPAACRSSSLLRAAATSRRTAACSARRRRGGARFPRGTLRLALLPGCGFITNTAFDAALNEYSPRYEETQGFSPRFTSFARAARRRAGSSATTCAARSVLEIGCGKGEFLVAAVRAGRRPRHRHRPGATSPSASTSAAADRIDVHQRPLRRALRATSRPTRWSAGTRSSTSRPVADSCGSSADRWRPRRHARVLRAARRAARAARGAFWDIYYEHCSYFTPGSLARLFRASGFEVFDLALDYDDQYLLIEARPSARRRPAAALEDDLGGRRRGRRCRFDATRRAVHEELARRATRLTQMAGRR